MADTTTVSNASGKPKVTVSHDNTIQDLTAKRLVQKNEQGEVLKSWDIKVKETRNLASTANTKTIQTPISSTSKTNKDGVASNWDWNTIATTPTLKTNLTADTWTKNDAGVVVNTSNDDYENARAAKRNQLKKEKDEAQFKENMAKIERELPMDIKELRDIVYSLVEYNGLTIESANANKTPEEIIQDYKNKIITAQKTLYNYIADIISLNKNTSDNSYNIGGYNGTLREEFSEKFDIFNADTGNPLEIEQVKATNGTMLDQYILSGTSGARAYYSFEKILKYVPEKLLTYLTSNNTLAPLVKPEKTNNTKQVDVEYLKFTGAPFASPGLGSFVMSPDEIIDTLSNILEYMKIAVSLNPLLKTSSNTQQSGGGTGGTGDIGSGTGGTSISAQDIVNLLKPIEDRIQSLAERLDNLIASNSNLSEYNSAKFVEAYKTLDQLLIYATLNYVTKHGISIDTFYTDTLINLKNENQKTVFRFALNDPSGRLELTEAELNDAKYEDAKDHQELYFTDAYLDSVTNAFNKNTTTVTKPQAPLTSGNWSIYIAQLKTYLLDLINGGTLDIQELNAQRLAICNFIGELFNMSDYNTETYMKNVFILDDETDEVKENFINLLASVGIIAEQNTEKQTITVKLKDPTNASSYTERSTDFYKYNIRYDYLQTNAPYNKYCNEYYMLKVYDILNTMFSSSTTTTPENGLPSVKLNDPDGHTNVPSPKWLIYWYAESGMSEKTSHDTQPTDPSITAIDIEVKYYTIQEWITKMKTDWLKTFYVVTTGENPYYIEESTNNT